MNKLQQKLATLGLVIMGTWISNFDACGQYSANIMDTGTVVGDVTLIDINGNKNSLYSYLNQGYTVAIELSLTTCTICWAFHEEGVFENIYKKYGPQGTVLPRKILPILMECNPESTPDDLHGKGNNTVGDWVKGVTHPIVDLNKDNYKEVLFKFLKPGKTTFPTPTFLVICPDRKVVYSGEGAGAMWEEKLVTLMEGRCVAGGKATGIEPLIAPSSVKLYPNPAEQVLFIHLETFASIPTQFSILNVLGQTLLTEQVSLGSGMQTTSLNINQLPVGMYLLHIASEQGSIQQKFVVER